jgi:hypothetical protein
MQDAARRRRLAEQYLALVTEVPVYRLSYPTDYTRLAAVVELIERQVAGTDGGSLR